MDKKTVLIYGAGAVAAVGFVWLLTHQTSASASTVAGSPVMPNGGGAAGGGVTSYVIPPLTVQLPSSGIGAPVIFNYTPPAAPPQVMPTPPAIGGTTASAGTCGGPCNCPNQGVTTYGDVNSQASAAGATLVGLAALLNTPEVQQAYAWKKYLQRQIGAENTVMLGAG